MSTTSKAFAWPFTNGWPLLWLTVGLLSFGTRQMLFALRLQRVRAEFLDDVWRFFQLGRRAYLVDALGVVGGAAIVLALFTAYLWAAKKFSPT